jgi:hypothetical protein
MQMKRKTRNPYGNTKKRKAALAWMLSKGITQPRPLWPCLRAPTRAHQHTLKLSMVRK